MDVLSWSNEGNQRRRRVVPERRYRYRSETRAEASQGENGRFQEIQHEKIPTAGGLPIFGPEATVAQDLEPEYIAMLPHSPFAWVSLQENNAIARVNVLSGKVATIIPLGYKDHGQAIDGLDASDKDDAINIMPYEGVLGMYQPDAIAAYRVRNQTYLVTANEGDARDYDGFGEEERVEDLTLDPEAFPNSAHLQEESVLGRLTVTDTLGDIDNDGDYDKLYAFGGRSFSILKYTRHGLKKVLTVAISLSRSPLRFFLQTSTAPTMRTTPLTTAVTTRGPSRKVSPSVPSDGIHTPLSVLNVSAASWCMT